jgi:hypothetical protein
VRCHGDRIDSSTAVVSRSMKGGGFVGGEVCSIRGRLQETELPR